MTFRNDRIAPSLRLFAGIVAAALLTTSGGCVMTPRSVALDGPNTVTEGRAKRDLGIDYLASRRTAMAIRELKGALALEPLDPQTHLWLGEAYRRKGRVDEAESYLVRAIELAKPIVDTSTEQAARLNLSALLSQLGRYEESLQHCEVLAADPTFSSPWRPLTNCGWSLLQMGRLEEARAHFEEALDFHPRFGPALLNLGILQAKQGHTLAAVSIFERAIDVGSLNSSTLGEAHYRLGEIFVGLGRRDMAVEHFRAASESSPDRDWGTQSQAYLDLLH